MKNIIAIVLALVMSISSFVVLSCSALSPELEEVVKDEYNSLLETESDETFYVSLMLKLVEMGFPRVYLFESYYNKNECPFVIGYIDFEKNKYVVDRNFVSDGSVKSYAIPYDFYMNSCE